MEPTESLSAMMDVVMPIQEGRLIPPEVLDGMASQGVPLRLFVSTRFSDGEIADARNQVKAYGMTPYILMLDNDVVLPPSSLRSMTDFLDTHADYGAVALCKHRYHRFASEDAWLHAYHVDMSCVLFRKDVLDGITFVDHRNAGRIGRTQSFDRLRTPLAGGCECANACWDIRQMGLEIGFLPNVYAAHLHHARILPEATRQREF